MRRLPIDPVNMPRDLKAQANGKLDANILKPITGGKMHRLASQAFSAMEAAAKKDGVVLKPTSQADAYRPLAVQERAFLSRYDNVARASVPRSYRGKRWWLKPGNAPAAVPGTSNHGWGLAVDIAGIDQKKVEWLLKNAKTFGFSWELQNEPWHLRYVAGDSVPSAVSAWLQDKTVAKKKVVANTTKTIAKKSVTKKHKVVSGETLTSIAKKYGTTVKAIAEVNKIKNSNVLSIGQVLIIPPK